MRRAQGIRCSHGPAGRPAIVKRSAEGTGHRPVATTKLSARCWARARPRYWRRSRRWGRSSDPEPAQDIELVVEEVRKTVRQSYPVSVTGPRRGNGRDSVGDRLIAKHAIGSCGLPACRAAHAVDVGRSSVDEPGTSHVVHLVVGIGG